MSKCNVAVLFGGRSSEYEVSCLSAASVIKNIPEDDYHIIPVGITKKGNWFLYSGGPEPIADGSWEQHPQNQTAFLSPDPGVKGLMVRRGETWEVLPVDVIFPVLHGKNGEDGTIQGLFQLSGIPYVGCDTASSAICMDKAVTNMLLDAIGVEQAKFIWFYAADYEKKRDSIQDDIEERLFGYPVFVKPAKAGSSVGVSKVHSSLELDAAVAAAAREDSKIVIEESIDGQEVECAVLGNQTPQASVVGEIAAAAEFYDYNDKYKNGESELYIPAHLDESVMKNIQTAAVRAYRALGCSGLSRVDFFVRREDQAVLLNEINTLPGFTSISMYPKLWQACGVSYGELLNRLIELALQKTSGE